MPTKIERDPVSGTPTTGHEWDGIKELDTPMPTWWLYVLYATIAWSIGLFVLYPSLPGVSGYFSGVIGYSARDEVAAKMRAADETRAPFVDRIRKSDLATVRNDPELLAYSVAGGRVAFAENCAGCHQAGGAGTKGYPSLADDEWLWGGSLAEIQRTIQYGIRSTHAESRVSAMPRFGLDGILDRQQIDQVAEHVLGLSGRSSNRDAAAKGAPLYAENCASCHGDGGLGNRELGAPNLADNVWLYGGDKASVVKTIAEARNGVMPAWGDRLDPAVVKMLTIYVHALGGGEK
jgi:cytochrome c oxidase cbb3-type subunit 3